jgi:hypothetical protein
VNARGLPYYIDIEECDYRDYNRWHTTNIKDLLYIV